jgi:hypothetical protein
MHINCWCWPRARGVANLDKNVTYRSEEIKECIAHNNNSIYLLTKVLHIYCKKGIHQILSDMVSEYMLEGHETILSYHLTFIKLQMLQRFKQYSFPSMHNLSS